MFSGWSGATPVPILMAVLAAASAGPTGSDRAATIPRIMTPPHVHHKTLRMMYALLNFVSAIAPAFLATDCCFPASPPPEPPGSLGEPGRLPSKDLRIVTGEHVVRLPGDSFEGRHALDHRGVDPRRDALFHVLVPHHRIPGNAVPSARGIHDDRLVARRVSWCGDDLDSIGDLGI